MYEVTFDDYRVREIDADQCEIDAEMGWIHFAKDGQTVTSVSERNVIAIDRNDSKGEEIG